MTEDTNNLAINRDDTVIIAKEDFLDSGIQLTELNAINKIKYSGQEPDLPEWDGEYMELRVGQGDVRFSNSGINHTTEKALTKWSYNHPRSQMIIVASGNSRFRSSDVYWMYQRFGFNLLKLIQVDSAKNRFDLSHDPKKI